VSLIADERRATRRPFRAETRSVFLDDATPETSVPGASRGDPSHRDAAPRMPTQTAGVCADDTTTGSNAANERARVVHTVPPMFQRSTYIVSRLTAPAR
jgi:hypothetical protein